MATICLCMIVRNESRVIRRLLDSVVNFVQEYVIVDTGSTDDTIAQIEAHALPGKVVRRSFINFGVSRTFALEQARLLSKSMYVLLLDADMVLKWTPPIPLFVHDAYYVVQKSGLSYRNIRLLRRELPVTCVGATHEYYDLPPQSVVGELPEDKVWIQDLGDGGCKSDKFARDLALLEAELRVRPNDPRTVFYYAQTCYDVGKYGRALDFYMHRVALGGWDQEVWYSKFRVGLCCVGLSDLRQARVWMDALLDAKDNVRAEPAYYMCKALREQGQYEAAYYYCLRGLKFVRPPPVAQCLFVEHAVYDFLLKFERSVLWYYLEGHPRDVGLDFCLELLDSSALIPQATQACVYNNLVFYVPALASRAMSCKIFPNEHWDHDGDRVWRYSSPGFLEDGTVYCRLVNYFLNDDGSYKYMEKRANTRLLVGDKVVDTTHNRTAWYNSAASILGLEDTRVFRDTRTGILHTLSATMEYSRGSVPHEICQAVGILDVDAGTCKPMITIHAVIQSPTGQVCEKNWVVAGGLDTVVYRWFPDLVVGRVDLLTEKFVETRRLAVPGSFRGMRGSTHGFWYQDKWWFVTHAVVDSHTNGLRKYMHRIVVLSKDMDRIVKYSTPFTFEENADIEYCLGFSIQSHKASFGFSTRDRSPKLLTIPLHALIV